MLFVEFAIFHKINTTQKVELMIGKILKNEVSDPRKRCINFKNYKQKV